VCTIKKVNKSLNLSRPRSQEENILVTTMMLFYILQNISSPKFEYFFKIYCHASFQDHKLCTHTHTHTHAILNQAINKFTVLTSCTPKNLTPLLILKHDLGCLPVARRLY
jgi:hypothetical protein